MADFGSGTPQWLCGSFLTLQNSVGDFLPSRLPHSRSDCVMVWWLPQPSLASSTFPVIEISLHQSPWCQLYEEPRLTQNAVAKLKHVKTSYFKYLRDRTDEGRKRVSWGWRPCFWSARSQMVGTSAEAENLQASGIEWRFPYISGVSVMMGKPLMSECPLFAFPYV